MPCPAKIAPHFCGAIGFVSGIHSEEQGLNPEYLAKPETAWNLLVDVFSLYHPGKSIALLEGELPSRQLYEYVRDRQRRTTHGHWR